MPRFEDLAAEGQALVEVGGAVVGVDVATQAELDAAQAAAVQRANHTGEQPVATVTGLQGALDAKAPLASPALTGTPTVPTAPAGTNTTQAASTAFVKAATDATSGPAGSTDASDNLLVEGHASNSIAGGNANSIVGGGTTGNLNTITGTADLRTIVGGYDNTVGANLASGIIASFHSVVSGTTTHGTIVGGSTNQITGSDYGTVIGGQDNTLSGLNSVIVGGASNTVSGANAFATGNANTVSGSGSAALGQSNTVTGASSLAVGISNTVENNYSQAFGRGARARMQGQEVISSQESSVVGDRQASRVVLKRTTTDATSSILGPVGSNTSYTVLEGQTVGITAIVVARQASTGDSAMFEIKALAKRELAGSSALVAPATVTKLFASAGAEAWSMAVVAGSSAGSVSLRAVGEVDKTIEWVAQQNMVEVLT